jgi:hypothetical protein
LKSCDSPTIGTVGTTEPNNQSPPLDFDTIFEAAELPMASLYENSNDTQFQTYSFLPGPQAADIPNVEMVDSFSWEMIQTGIEEPLPTQEVIEEL